MGWVHRRRDLGNLLFLDVRDRTGLVQAVFNKETQASAHAKAEQVRSEFVVAVKGKVVKRQKANAELASGEIELVATKLHILNKAKTPPFAIEDEITAAEETRLRFRYLDLRRPKPRRNLALRHKLVLEMRKVMDELGFIEVETPMLTRSTPEGARDYLVPSRIHHGQFYALPQSPQIFKQILMIAGMDKYFQIVKCFRDEDLRADRQPEFTQLDLEMSFPRQEDIFHVIETVMVRTCAVAGITVTAPFPHLLYQDVIRKYGSRRAHCRAIALAARRSARLGRQVAMEIPVDYGLSALRVERNGENLGQRAASVHGHRGRGPGQAGIRAVGSALKRLRPCAERLRAWLRQHSYSPPGHSGAFVQSAGPERRAASPPLWLLPRRIDLRYAAARRDCARRGSYRHAPCRRKIHPRSRCFRQNHRRAGFDGRISQRSGPRATRRAWPHHQARSQESRRMIFLLASLGL